MENTSDNLPTENKHFFPLSYKPDHRLCPQSLVSWYVDAFPSDTPFHRLILKLCPENKNEEVTAAFSAGPRGVSPASLTSLSSIKQRT